jgi:peptidoglycan/LPS O-acetylase OafA/YrhL
VGNIKVNLSILILRVFLTFGIFLYHFNFNFQLLPPKYTEHLYLAVDAFFVLSGFLISGLLAFEQKYPRFLKSRVIKLYPVHIIGIAFVFGIMAVRAAFGFFGCITLSNDNGLFLYPNDLTGLLQQVFLLNGLGITERLSWNYPSWSISTEILLYSVFGLIATFWKERLGTVYLICGTICILILIQFTHLNFTTLRDANGIPFMPMVRGVLGFSFGALCYQYLLGRRWPLILSLPLLFLAIWQNFALSATLATVLFLILPAVNFSMQRGMFRRISDVLVAFYIFHAGAIMVADILHRRIFTSTETLSILAFAMVLTLILSIAATSLIELFWRKYDLR